MQVDLNWLTMTVKRIEVMNLKCEQVLRDPHFSDRVKVRVIRPEYDVYLLALEGAKVLQQKANITAKDVSFAMPPAPTVGPQTD